MATSSYAGDPDDPARAVLTRMRKARQLTGALSRALGTRSHRIRPIRDRTELAQSGMTDWLAPFLSVPDGQKTVSSWEAAAESTRQFESAVVPGLLQTSGYATALLRGVQQVFPLRADDLRDSLVLNAVSGRIAGKRSWLSSRRRFDSS